MDRDMALLGSGAMVLWFDIVPEGIVEHDDWHTHEHLPERLSIPGFLRGSRWKALAAPLNYFVFYDVDEVDTLVSEAYLARLNAPTPWTARMMKHYRRMTRGFCRATGSFGTGIGHVCAAIRCKPEAHGEAALRDWLMLEALPRLPSRPGLTSAHLLENTIIPPLTNEQRIRGNDATVDWLILALGYSDQAVQELCKNDLSPEALARHGGKQIIPGTYRLEYSLLRPTACLS
jgi:hypothetical protein